MMVLRVLLAADLESENGAECGCDCAGAKCKWCCDDEGNSGGSQLGRAVLRDEVSNLSDLDDHNDDLGRTELPVGSRRGTSMARYEAELDASMQPQMHGRGMLAAAELGWVHATTAGESETKDLL